jgi:N-hydroxyarylamine O-acetyltransferase
MKIAPTAFALLLVATFVNEGLSFFIPRPIPSGTTTATCQMTLSDDDATYLTARYLDRIGIPSQEATQLANNSPPNMQDLERLLRAHIQSVPFENLDQHTHRAQDDGTTLEIPRRTIDNLPSLDVIRSVRKIVLARRGGFCYELNFSFCWLLRSLGYRARLALAEFRCRQPIPAHVVILVDGLLNDERCVLVDVGFGYPGVCEVPLPVVFDSVLSDPHGDSFRFLPDNRSDRFDTRLVRNRIKKPGVDEPMYRFLSTDDMAFDSDEFAAGLETALTTSELFTKKRICVISTDSGHVTLGNQYIKWVEKGDCVRQIELPTEAAYRSALKDYFGVELTSA